MSSSPHCNNDIVQGVPTPAKISAGLELSGLYCSDGKHLDSITVVPWKFGKLLVLDATCPDTLAPLYFSSATSEAGAMASQAEERKEAKYVHLNPVYSFSPVAIETSEVFGLIEFVTGEVRSTNFLIQRLLVAVQCGNSVSVLGTMDHSAPTDIFPC